MDCRDFRELVMTTRAADRSQADLERLAAHELHCEACRRFNHEAEVLERLLQTTPSPAAPADFTRRVMARVTPRREPSSASWYERVFGVLRAPAPAFPLRQTVAVVALMVMVVSLGMWAVHNRNLPGGSVPTVSVAHTPGGQVIQVDKAFVDEVIARHQTAASMQPLSDDDGMRLVSY